MVYFRLYAGLEYTENDWYFSGNAKRDNSQNGLHIPHNDYRDKSINELIVWWNFNKWTEQ